MGCYSCFALISSVEKNSFVLCLMKESILDVFLADTCIPF